jgi:thiamine biosynthesis lipoprotein
VRARWYFDLTLGLFDPAVGGVLAAFGYDRSFAPGALDRAAATLPGRAGSFLDIGLDPSRRSVDRPCHVQIDLGGMIKGATVDAAARHLDGRGAIDAGGDAILLGLEPTRGEWLVDIEDPRNAEQVLLTVAVSGGALATSAPNRRTWKVGGRAAHHLIDPRTLAPSASDLLQATVFAPRAELADVLAKTAFLLGSREGKRFVANHGATGAVLVGRDGEVLVSGQVRVREIGHA